MQSKFDLIIISDCVLDIYYRIDSLPISMEEAVNADNVRFYPGGACTVAILASRLGLKVGVIDKLGSDCFSSILLRELQAAGVNTEMIKLEEGEVTAVSNNIYDKRGRHAFLGFSGAGKMLKEDEIKNIDSTRAIFFDGYNLDGMSPASEAITNTAIAAHNSSKKIFFDPGPRLSNKARDLIEISDFVFFNKRELRMYTGKNYEDSILELKNKKSTFIIKEGASGSTCVSNGQVFHAKGFRVKNPEHTIGAGDAFDATFIALLLNGIDIKKACIYSNLMVSLKLKASSLSELPSLSSLINMAEKLSTTKHGA